MCPYKKTQYKPCRFDGSPATVLVALSDGCICHPEDREQWLCEQHFDRMTPLGTYHVLEDLLAPT